MEGVPKVVLRATKEKAKDGYRVLLHMLRHESVNSLRAVVRAYLNHVCKKIAPLFQLATWVEAWKHPLTRTARSHAARLARAVRAVLSVALKNLGRLLHEAARYATKHLVKKVDEAKRRGMSEVASAVLAGIVASRGGSRSNEDAAGGCRRSSDLESAPAVSAESPALPPPEPSPLPLEQVVSASPKDDIRSLCSFGDLIDLNSENDTVSESVFRSPAASPRATNSVPRMWQSYNPDDILSCAKTTPACRAKYCEIGASPDLYSCTETEEGSMATARSGSEYAEGEDDEVRTPESVKIDMTVYSTGTPFRENVARIQSECQTLDFGTEAKSPVRGPVGKENAPDGDCGAAQDQVQDQALPVPYL